MKKMILFSLSTIFLLSACRKNDGPSVDDNFLSYDIPDVPVTADYNVGVWYYSFGSFNANIKEVPTVGAYSMPSGNITTGIMEKHIDTASISGLDYFVFQLRSATRDNNNFKNDSVLVRRFVDANVSHKMKFAVAYNFSSGTYGLNATTPLENDATKLQQFIMDIERLMPYLQQTDYMKVNGKILLYIVNAFQIFSNNNEAIYIALRNRMKTLGVELYIVGMQDRWSPPARYPFRFKNCVDAICHQSFVTQLNNWDRFYLLPQTIDQNWQYSKAYFKDSLNVDYVPNISPAYNWLIQTPTSLNPNVSRNDNGEMYRKLCNVAKRNASTETRLILIDSWNKWDEDSQLEPARSYGQRYLDVTRQQFKKSL